jgi:hypothetical protein
MFSIENLDVSDNVPLKILNTTFSTAELKLRIMLPCAVLSKSTQSRNVSSDGDKILE